jgi:outer membrane receptor protein involved in Fe transport
MVRVILCLSFLLFAFPAYVTAAEEGRKIEEVIVTAERREASVSDTSISITALTGDTLDDFGIRNQSDLQAVIPATTIQPYDSAIRGVGRNFRNLGGDPGVSTYINSVYSEDLYTATIGSFWDIDRIEVLRGPQGTLYGRNAVGGAINFLYKRPTPEWEASFKGIVGSYDTRDIYGMVSGPLIRDRLLSRLTFSQRRHDGWVEERGDGPDLDSGDERNVALQFEWQINDSMTFNVRGNRADVDRVFGGADGGGLIVLAGENTVLPVDDFTRNYEVQNHGMRAVDPTEVNPLSDAFLDPTQPTYNYTNPTTGDDILSQRIRPGVDPGVGSGRRNHGRNVSLPNDECLFLDRKDIKGDDLCAYTNGLNVEDFEQQAVQAEFNWDLSEQVTLKYIFGYNDLMYERITDDDSTFSSTDDRQFYVNHEAEYVSHELQLFWDVGDSMSFTSGIFFYDATIDQRYDFYSAVGAEQFTDPEYALDNILATVAPGVIEGDPPLTFAAGTELIDVHSARDAAEAAGAPLGDMTTVTGPWLGDLLGPEGSLGSIPNGPKDTPGSDTHATNKTEREAFAIYTQGTWDINERFALTLGIRYAEDEVKGQENGAIFTETMTVLDGVGLTLAEANIVRGAINPLTLQPTGAVEPWLGGVPIQLGLHRSLERKDDDITWRVNLDYHMTDNTMVYGNVTTGSGPLFTTRVSPAVRSSNAG